MSETPSPLDVYEVLAVMLDQAASLAWQKMGLQPDMMTGKVHQDLAQCKAAIDAASALAAVVEPKLDEDDRRQIQNLLRDLRVNYAQRVAS